MAINIPRLGRLTGNPPTDVQTIAQWAFDLYQALELSNGGIPAQVETLQLAVLSLDARLDAVEARLDAIAALAQITQVLTDPVTDDEGAIIQAKVNAIIAAATAPTS